MNKLCVDIIILYVTRRKGKKENLHLNGVMTINPVTGWFEITQYNDKITILIADLVDTMWMHRYSIPIEITHDQGSEFIAQKFRKSLIEI